MTTFVPPELADFEPKRREISDVTNAAAAVVTTTEAHGYEAGLFVRLHVVAPNPMVLDSVKAEIIDVPTTTTFATNVDTTDLFAFDAPTFPRIVAPQGFTQAHVVPITGDVTNVAGPLTGNPIT